MAPRCLPVSELELLLGTLHARHAQTKPSAQDGSSLATVLSIAGASELGVTGAQREHMAIYLRTFFRLLSSWVHWGEIAESAGSRPGLHDFSPCSDEGDEGPPAHGQESGASTAWTLSSYRSGWKVAWRSRVATRGTSLRRGREIAVQASNAASEPAIDESQSEAGFAIAGRGGNHGRADQ